MCKIIAQLLVENDTTEKSEELILMMLESGFKLNPDFKHYAVPVHGTRIVKTIGPFATLIVQEEIKSVGEEYIDSVFEQATIDLEEKI